jgi:hypothetical protein
MYMFIIAYLFFVGAV